MSWVKLKIISLTILSAPIVRSTGMISVSSGQCPMNSATSRAPTPPIIVGTWFTNGSAAIEVVFLDGHAPHQRGFEPPVFPTGSGA
jgi:hypothetical protein